MLTYRIEMRHGIDSCNDGTLKGLGSQKHTLRISNDSNFQKLSFHFYAVLVLYGVFESSFKEISIQFPQESVHW